MALAPINVGGVPLAIPPRPADFGTAPGALSVASYLGWPVSDQADYVQLNGAGVPPRVMIGPAGSQRIIASVPTSGFAVDIVHLPANFNTAPATLTATDFLDWNSAQQSAYLIANGGGPLTVGAAGTLQISVAAGAFGPAITFLAPTVLPHLASPLPFGEWNPGFQIAYVNAFGTGTPKSVIIGNDLGDYKVLATLNPGGQSVKVEILPVAFTKAPNQLDAAEFLNWSSPVQLAYLTASGAAPPVTIGLTAPAGSPQITAAPAANAPVITFLAPSVPAASLTSAVFSSWSVGHQLAYVNANGTGTPKSLVFGPAAGPQFLAVANGNTGVDVSSLPADFGTAPTALEANAFLKWGSDEQLAYVRARGGGPVVIGVTPAGPTISATVGGSSVLLAVTASTTLPGALSTATFQAWHPRLQLAYLNTYGVGDPKGIEIGVGHPKLLTYLQTSQAPDGTPLQAVEITYPPTEFATAPGSLDMATFMRFSPRLQLAYARVWGPAAVVVGANNAPQVRATVNAGQLGVTLSYPATSTLPTALDPVIFLSWPIDVRVAYVNTNGTVAAPATTKSVVIGRAADRKLTATMTAAGNNLTYDSFWSAQAQILPNSVIDAIPTNVPIPYHFLAGSDVGIESLLNNQTAQTKFPTYDGVANKLGNLPTGIDTPDEFLSLHSAHQLEILKNSALTVSVTGGTRKVLTLPPGAAAGSTGSITIVEGDADDRLYVIENLQKRDLAIMPKLDQEAVAATGGAFTKKATEFGLTSSRDLILNGDGNAGSPTQLGINDIIDAIKNAATGFPDSLTTKGLMTKADRDVFLGEINAIADRVNNSMAVFSAADILKQCNDILTRFKRAEAFATVPAQGRPPQNNTEYVRIASLDNNATIEAGYRKFIEQEKRLLALENARIGIANTGASENKKLDAPNLVFLFQLYYNLTTEAKVGAETEEINQQNALLKTYSEMQRLVNATKQFFVETDSKKAQEEKRGILGKSEGLPAGLSDTEMKVIAMFEDYLAQESSGHRAKHPIEELRGITRPATHEFFANASASPTVAPQLRTWWDSVATQLSDTVSLINQESQIKMNDINSMDKQKNRHFDLANSALQKMNEMIQNIARAGG